MESKVIQFDMLKYRGVNSTVYTGRPQGEGVRKELCLDRLDKSDSIIKFSFPKDTTTITPSFFLGLLYSSIKSIGFEKYKKKYLFEFDGMNSEVSQILESDIEEGERNALNTINKKRGVSRFFK